MKNIIFLIVFAVMFYGCDESVKYIEPDNKPMWPQFGYDGRQTGNNASDVYISPVVNGTLEWSFANQNGALTDGSEYCVDSQGNIYYQDDNQPGSLFKFAPDGRVIWKRDSLTSSNFSAVSLNKEETRVYFHTINGLYCYDSSGNRIWSNPWPAYNKVIIDGEGVIYTYTTSGFSAINPDGSIKWSNGNIPYNSFSAGRYNAMDRDGNIYISGSMISKLNKNGALLWQFSFDTVNAYSIGLVIDGFNNLYFREWRKKILYSTDKDGNLRWKKDNNGGTSISIPVIGSDNTIYIQDGFIKAININGDLIWSAQGGADNIILDSEDNLYFLIDNLPAKVSSLTKDGQLRWTYQTNIGSTLPNPVLSPLGKLIFSPKRGYTIYCLN